MTDSLEADRANMRLLQFLGAPDPDAPETQSEIKAARFLADKKASKARKQLEQVKKTAKKHQLQKMKLLKSFEDVEAVSSSVMGSELKGNVSSPKRMNESKMRRFIVQKNLERTINSSGKNAMLQNSQSMGALMGTKTGRSVKSRVMVMDVGKAATKTMETAISFPRL